MTQRRREIGIRTALGATPPQVLRAIGHGPAGVALIGGAIALVDLLAALGPARRGLRIPPGDALKADA